MNFELNPLLYFTSEDEMADGLEKVAGEGFGSSEAQIVHALDDLAEALGTDGFGILERSGDGTRLGEAVQSALAALEALKRAEAEVPEGAKEIRSPNLPETFAGDDEFLAAMLEESIAFCGGKETDVRRTLEQTAKRLGFTYEALMKGAADGTAVGRVVAQVKREHPAFARRN